MKVAKKVILVLLVVLIVIQFFHPNTNWIPAKSPNNISFIYPVPANVSSVLKKACNDCHSDSTRYPWYSNIQPVTWWLKSHIDDGKRSLDFDQFTTYRISKQYKRMNDVIEVVKKDEMPLSSYTLIHTDAKLSEQEKQLLISWAQSIVDTMKATYPADSLKRNNSRR